MDLVPTDEQVALRDAVRGLLGEEVHPPAGPGDFASAVDQARHTWRRMVDELGVHALVVPEELGGGGGSWTDVAIVLGECGRTLSPAPFLSTACLIATVQSVADADVAAEMLGPMVAGALPGAVALLDGDGAVDSDRTWGAHAARTDGGLVVSGSRHFVAGADIADVLLVAAEMDGDPALFWVSRDADGLTVETHPTLDPTRTLGTVHLDRSPARPISRPRRGRAAVEVAVDLFRVAIAIESAGAANQCLEDIVAYLKVREQFGRALATRQALQHRCADLATLVQGAEATAAYASWVVASGSDELHQIAPLAKAVCVDAFRHVAAEAVQMHGGIGFTWEHRTHLYLKRATTSGLLLGTSRELRRLVDERAGITHPDRGP